MIFVKISQNFIKSLLKLCPISQISVHSLGQNEILYICGSCFMQKKKIIRVGREIRDGP